MHAAIKHHNAPEDHLPHVDAIGDCLEYLSGILETAVQPIASTKFSPDSAIFLHLVTSIVPDIPIIWVDTGYNTRDTLEFARHLESRLNLNLNIYRPVNRDITIPPELDTPEHEAFSKAIKLAPFERAITFFDPDLWLSSLRRHQSSFRSTLTVQEAVSQRLVKAYPMLEWSQGTVNFYRSKYSLPSGPPVYDPTKGEPLRECGLHTKRWEVAAASAGAGASAGASAGAIKDPPPIP